MKAFLQKYTNYLIFLLILLLLITLKIINPAFIKSVSYLSFDLYQKIFAEKKDSEVVKIDSRTSDAIALSIRFNAPIFVTKEILDEAGFEDDKRYSDGINLTDENFFKDNLSVSTDSKTENTKDIKKISTRNIRKMLEKSIQNEDYELAARLRDELDFRKKV